MRLWFHDRQEGTKIIRERTVKSMSLLLCTGIRSISLEILKLQVCEACVTFCRKQEELSKCVTLTLNRPMQCS